MASTVKGKVVTPAGSEITTTFPLSAKLTEHCAVSEAANTSASDDIKFIYGENMRLLLEAYEDFRSILVAAGICTYMALNSVYRTEAYNRECGGIEGSHHCTGEAFDWGIKRGGMRVTMTDPLRKVISAMWQYVCKVHGRVGYICWYTGGFHCDIASDGVFMIYDYRGTSKDW